MSIILYDCNLYFHENELPVLEEKTKEDRKNHKKLFNFGDSKIFWSKVFGWIFWIIGALITAYFIFKFGWNK